MTRPNIIDHIRQTYSDCTAPSCKEKNCALQLDNVAPNSLAIIHGTKYQKTYGLVEKLCDRMVFCAQHGFILAAVELKSGRNINMSDAIKQIQTGLGVAAYILNNRPVAEWLPVLLYSGGMNPYETKLLQSKSVKFRGERKLVIKRNCGTKLSAIL